MKYAAAHDITFDDELYFVAAMLHDLALTAPPFDSHRIAFEEAGGDLAWVFAVAAGWPVDRAARAEEIIVLHMRDDVAADVDPESHLLQVATAWDVAGRRPEEFASEVRASPRAVSPGWDSARSFWPASKTRPDASRTAPRQPPSRAMVPRESGRIRSTSRRAKFRGAYRRGMRATVMYEAGDVRVEEVPDPPVLKDPPPTRSCASPARASAAAICGRTSPCRIRTAAAGWGTSSSASSRTSAPT